MKNATFAVTGNDRKHPSLERQKWIFFYLYYLPLMETVLPPLPLLPEAASAAGER